MIRSEIAQSGWGAWWLELDHLLHNLKIARSSRSKIRKGYAGCILDPAAIRYWLLVNKVFQAKAEIKVTKPEFVSIPLKLLNNLNCAIKHQNKLITQSRLKKLV